MKQRKLDNVGILAVPHFKIDKWFFKIVKKKKEVNIPGVVLHLESERICEEWEMWKI